MYVRLVTRRCISCASWIRKHANAIAMMVMRMNSLDCRPMFRMVKGCMVRSGRSANLVHNPPSPALLPPLLPSQTIDLVIV